MSLIGILLLSSSVSFAYPTYKCKTLEETSADSTKPIRSGYVVVMGGSQAIVRYYDKCEHKVTSVAGHKNGNSMDEVIPFIKKGEAHDYEKDHKLYMHPIKSSEGTKFESFQDEKLQQEGVLCQFVGIGGFTDFNEDLCAD